MNREQTRGTRYNARGVRWLINHEFFGFMSDRISTIADLGQLTTRDTKVTVTVTSSTWPATNHVLVTCWPAITNVADMAFVTANRDIRTM